MSDIEEIKKEHAVILGFLNAKETKGSDLREMLEHSLLFFNKLKQVLIDGNDEEKEEVRLLMQSMQGALHQNLKKLCERVGMNEEQLFKFCENPNNFNTNQWSTMEEAKQKLLAIGEELKKEKRKRDAVANPFAGETEPSKAKRTKRKDWMAS